MSQRDDIKKALDDLMHPGTLGASDKLHAHGVLLTHLSHAVMSLLPEPVEELPGPADVEEANA